MKWTNFCVAVLDYDCDTLPLQKNTTWFYLAVICYAFIGTPLDGERDIALIKFIQKKNKIK